MIRKFVLATSVAFSTLLSVNLLANVNIPSDPISDSQKLIITLIGESFFDLEKEQMEVIFDASEGLLQEKSVSSPYHIVNIGPAREVTGSVDHLPPGITISATMGVPDSVFSDIQPISIPDVVLTTTPALVLNQIHRVLGTGTVTYKVGCDASVASPSDLQAHVVIVSYTMAVLTSG